VKLGILALDYDGTLTQDGRLDPSLRAVLREARERGIVVVIVTGRVLEDLRAAAGDLRWADAVVAENGAVVALPEGYERRLAPPPPPSLLEALAAAGIPVSGGQCVLDAAADVAPRLLAEIRRLELPLALAFNRGRVMALPIGVCKSSGLREVLRGFRLSPHNALGIGDAENDHDLLAACEVGAAVEWGSPALRAVADDIVPGRGPADVAKYLRRALGRMRLPEGRRAGRSVLLGRRGDGAPVTISVREPNLLVAGDPRSGKSWAAGLVCEQLAVLGYSLCILDPEGDYAPLENLPGFVVLGGGRRPPAPADVTRQLRHPDMSVVLDLSRQSHDQKTEYLRTLLPCIAHFRRRTGLPHRIVIDEAHYFLHRPDAREIVDLELGGYALVTYRVSELHPQVLRDVGAVVMTHTSDPREVRALARIVGQRVDGASWPALLGDLAIDEAVVIHVGKGEATAERFRLAPRFTSHVRHRAKYRDVPLPHDRAFVFTRASRSTGLRAHTLAEFVAGVLSEPDDVLDGHARRGDFSRWIADVFGDHPLAAELAAVEDHHAGGGAGDLRSALVASIEERYQLATRRRAEPGRPGPPG
jgi:hydroxymethylpyrimidine pyrophosphatase-like HAD family hydrolase